MKKVEESKITEKTLIPLSLVIVIIGGVSWLTTIHSKVSASEQGLKKLNNEKSAILEELKEQGKSLARIEGALGIKPVAR